jgi:gamma-glutamylcyclotransferase (GGCT)/AIG2-like uncharacterized protein YtfP
MFEDGSDLILFAYGSLRRGEPHHEMLEGATCIGTAFTTRGYRLVDLSVYPAMIEFRGHRVYGELYRVTREIRRSLDVLKEVPVLFQRTTVELEDGRRAQTYVMRDDQVPGRRRLRVEDWKQRFAPVRRGYR